ncbi:sigma-54 dependent transcriptional regulator [Ammoniphilus sp. CFH 90114]|uniref:sigma-54-dependent transcriptional regulator n=1 Tax=Ammoniphilus sp. CFH 90114 TaxID=2493665 RepID=UPI00100DACF3|nr:sigma-54 dependent transcriptional regulator [Ammoniphilus sp. CFH 90114]RXT02797.1 sigma-54-dependent Fis family transcriptional regulator [Ammoniphilus sp. CFH 90114]
MKPQLLIVDDEKYIATSLRYAFEDDYDVLCTTCPKEAYQLLSENRIDLVLLDWRLGEYNGLDVLAEMKKQSPHTSVIMMTAYGTIESSVEAMRRGAYHYVTKPVNLDELHLMMKKALEHHQLQTKLEQLHQELEELKGFDRMIGQSQAIQQVFSVIQSVKDIDSNIFIYGESGTGKELVAHAIHHQGRRRLGPFIVVNCAAIPENLLESELFGYEKGAFTGALKSKPGKWIEANGGTLFLDEIGEMPSHLQAKILRVLQEGEITPLGGSKTIKLDVRIISATNRNLLEMVQQGTFRQDLYFRLNVIPIELPPLRERQEDIDLLITFFIKKYCSKMNRPLKSLSGQAKDMLMNYDYPGNIRQLSNILEYAVALSKGQVIQPSDLPLLIDQRQPDHQQSKSVIQEDEASHNSTQSDRVEIPLGSSMKDVEKKMIEMTLKFCKGNRTQTSHILGMTDKSLRTKIKLYEID